jgi:hypothetical protein
VLSDEYANDAVEIQLQTYGDDASRRTALFMTG